MNDEFDIDRLFSCVNLEAGLSPVGFLGLSGTKSTSLFSIKDDLIWGNFEADENGDAVDGVTGGMRCL